MSKKRKFTRVIILLVVAGIVVFLTNDGINLLSSVLNTGNARRISCTDTDGGLNYTVFGRIFAVLDNVNPPIELQDSCIDQVNLQERSCRSIKLGSGALLATTYACQQGCANGMCRNCSNPEGVLACSLGLDTCDALCMAPIGYGYGYGRGGQGTGYGYGYGYQKLDPKTKKPYLYLINVFKTYSKSIYDAAISKRGFQMVKSYNKKEFSK